MQRLSLIARAAERYASTSATHLCSRRYATSASQDANATRNMALVAHIDSGKTTLTESILYQSSYLSSAGTVDTGSTTTDFLPEERERGITIQSASIPVKWKDWNLNLIDTPGHADFGMEVESASRVVDGAVVLIDSVEGVEAQTKGVWRQLDRYGVPTRIMFLNKLDRPGASFRNSLKSILAHRLHPNPMALTLPIASFNPGNYTHAEPGVEGVVDLVKWEVWKWNEEGESTRHPLPTNVEDLDKTGIIPASHPILPHLVPARTALLENLSMFSEELMEQLLELPAGPSSYLSVQPSTILPHLRACTLRKDILPVLCGSAMKHIGTELVLDYVGELLADPVSVSTERNPEKGPLRMLAWKVTWDKRKGWMTFVRVYSGSMHKQSVIQNTSRNQKEKATKLMLLYASDAQEVDELPFGSVGVILGLKYTRTGDTLVGTRGANSDTAMANIIPPPPVMSTSVIPHSQSDLGPVQDALASLSRTDPSVRVDTHEGQLLVHGLGALHLEIIERRLRDEWDVNFEFGKRRVSYREGLHLDAAGEHAGTWNTEIGGKPTQLGLTLDIRPLEEGEVGDDAWDGNLVVNQDGKHLPGPDASASAANPLTHIARGLATTLSNSPHTSLPFARVRIEVCNFSLPTHAPPTTLAGAAASVLRDLLRSFPAGPVLEPYIQLRITTPEDALGKVVKDLTESNGEVLDLAGSGAGGADEDGGAYPSDGVYVPPDWLSPSAASSHVGAASDRALRRRAVHAIAPLARMLDYSNRLRALSGGHGLFEMTNAGFKEVNDSRRLEILREIGRA